MRTPPPPGGSDWVIQPSGFNFMLNSTKLCFDITRVIDTIEKVVTFVYQIGLFKNAMFGRGLKVELHALNGMKLFLAVILQ